MDQAGPAPKGVETPRRRALTRFLRRVAPFLIFGMLATVAVAWAIEWTAWPMSGSSDFWDTWTKEHTRPVEPLKKWPSWIPHDWPPPTSSDREVDTGWRATVHGVLGPRFGPDGRLQGRFMPGDVWMRKLNHVEYGYPLLALSSGRAVTCVFKGGNPNIAFEYAHQPGLMGVINEGILIDRPSSGRLPPNSILPIRPVFPGFLLDTLFYALLAWIPFGAFAGVRALIRDAEGRCVACGYWVGDLAQCPECGRTVRRWGYRDDAAPHDFPEP